MADITDQDDESQQLLRDLLVLSSIPYEMIVAVSFELQGEKAFVSLGRLLNKHIGVPEAASAVARLVSNIDTETLPTILQMVESWREEFKGEAQPLTNEGFDSLKQNLTTLIQTSTQPAIERTKKAASLLTATGNEVTGLTFICDVRPVYNDEKTDIDGYVPLTTMKIYFDRPNEEQDAIEFVLTPEEIDTVIDRATKARDKLKVMQKKFSGWLANGNGEDI